MRNVSDGSTVCLWKGTGGPGGRGPFRRLGPPSDRGLLEPTILTEAWRGKRPSSVRPEKNFVVETFGFVYVEGEEARAR